MKKMSEPIQKTWIIMGGILVIALIGFGLFYSLANVSETVVGEGYAESKVIPDIIGIYLGINEKADTLSGAQEKSSEIYDSFISSMVLEGFEEEIISTTSLSVNPNYVWKNNENKQEGYIANHNLQIEISTEELDDLNKIISAAVNSGVGINYINFELSREKENSEKNRLIGLASENAREKANALATGVGKRLGKVVSISEGSFGYNPRIMYAESDSSIGGVEAIQELVGSISPSEQTVSSSVTVVYKLK